ncbi:hypothetical protein F2Q69_00008771 [Brassica cretica]|uniref:Uncharacterized protein n=1 Tax=Brassica cretica TaxID=69181 RepID=A0A8S9P9J4_BRACR|nr:hypothetical protein F2Q69_00008771 [Brassica cretica]
MSSSFNFPRPTTKADDFEDLYKAYGVDHFVFLDLAGTHETPKTVREGYYGAYLPFFHSCGLIFPIPEPILEILAELELSFIQILPNFLRYLIAFLVRAREEGLSIGLNEFRELVLVKRNQQNPGTFLVSPRPGRHVIEDIPYCDEKWREQFLFSRWIKHPWVNSTSLDFLGVGPIISVTLSGSSSMSNEIRGLIGILRGDRSNWSTFDQARIRAVFTMPEGTDMAPLVGDSEDEAEHSQEFIATPSVQTQSSDRLTRQLVRRSSFRTSGRFGRDATSCLVEPGLGRRDRCGDSQMTPVVGGCLARSAGCRLPSLASLAEKEAYAKVVVASFKVIEAFNKYVVVMEDHVVASRNDKEIESIGSEIKRLSKELEATKREGKRDAEKIEALTEDWKRVHQENEALKTQMVARKVRIAALEDKWTSKRKEVSAEIRLQEVAANIDLLNELKDGGLTVDAELARLKEMEGYWEDLVASATVPDWSLSELDLPQVSDDSMVQGGGDKYNVFGISLFGSLVYGEALILIKLHFVPGFTIVFCFAFACQSNMASRRLNPRDSDRARTRTGSVNAERIRSGDVNEALTEVLREETRLSRASTQEVKDLEGEKSATRVKSRSSTGSEGRDHPPKKAKTNGSDHRLGVSGEAAVAKPFHWQFSHSKDCPIMEDPDSVAHLVRHFKPARCPLPSLWNMMEHEAYAMEANNEFAATLEKRLQDVPRSGEHYEIKKVVRELKLGLKMAQDRERANAAQLADAEKLRNQAASLKARLRVVSNERKSALLQVSFLEAKVESSANKFSDNLRRATYEAKKALADIYLDVLVSLVEKCEKKKAATDCEARLREVMANIDLLKEIMNNNLLASDELLRLRTKEVELESELDVMAVSDFSVGKLDLSQISEDLPEDFFAKVMLRVFKAPKTNVVV